MFIAVEKLEHGLTRTLGEPTRFKSLAEADAAQTAEDWRGRGYTLCADLSTKAVIILDETKAIGVIQVVRVKPNYS